MFVTFDHARMKIPFPIAAEGEHYWTHVQLQLDTPWFLVIYELCRSDTDSRISSTVLISTAREVVAIAKHAHAMQTAIVTPAWLNGSGGWKMENLEEMWFGAEPVAKGGNTATVCVTERGTRHVLSAIEISENDLVDLRRVL